MILVTGATGLLGNSIVRELNSRGLRVRVYGRGGPDREELAGLDVEFVSGELDDASALQRAVDGCTAVIHSAAMIHIGYQRLDEARRVNVGGTVAIAQACRQRGIRMIYVSTVDTLLAALGPDQALNEEQALAGVGIGARPARPVNGRAKIACTYVLSKLEAEQALLHVAADGLDVVVLHPGLMLGPYDWKPSSGAMMLAVYKAPTVVAPRGTASVCDARDVARAAVDAIDRAAAGQHYILAGDNLGYPDLCRLMLETMQQRKRVFRMGPVIPASARAVDLWNRCTGAQERLFNGAAIAMGHLHHAYDSSKAMKQLNYARRPLDETLADAWHWLQRRFIEARHQ